MIDVKICPKLREITLIKTTKKRSIEKRKRQIEISQTFFLHFGLYRGYYVVNDLGSNADVILRP